MGATGATGAGTTGATGAQGTTGATGAGTLVATFFVSAAEVDLPAEALTSFLGNTVITGTGEKLVIAAAGVISNGNANATCDLQLTVDGTAEAFAALFVPNVIAGLSGAGYSMLFETATLAPGVYQVLVQATPAVEMLALSAQLQIMRVLV